MDEAERRKEKDKTDRQTRRQIGDGRRTENWEEKKRSQKIRKQKRDVIVVALYSSKEVLKNKMDGAFERINAAILKEGTNSQVISLVGRVVGYDGNGHATVEAADGGMVQVENVEPAFNYVEGMIAEIMGAPIGGDSIQVSFVGCSCLIFLLTMLSENSRISDKS